MPNGAWSHLAVLCTLPSGRRYRRGDAAMEQDFAWQEGWEYRLG